MNEEKNARDAHKGAQPASGNGSESAKESKLDAWIRQNVLGEHKPEEKIVHEPAPASENKPAQSPAQKPADEKTSQKERFLCFRQARQTRRW